VGALARAARPCGLGDTPPGSAALAAAARVEALSPEAWRRALEEEMTLVTLWAMRGSPVTVAVEDFPIFTLGLLPEDEEGTLRLITSGLAPVVERAGVPARELVERLAQRAREALDGRTLTKRELGRALRPAVPARLRDALDDGSPGISGDGPVSDLALTVARVLSLHGAFVFAPRAPGAEPSLVRTDQWLERPGPAVAPHDARAELVRRFLRAYAPASPDELAGWATVETDAAARRAARGWAARAWALVADELAEVARPDGSPAWALAADLPRLLSPPQPRGVRLLPPHDPMLALRDRATLVPPEHQRRVWRAQANPGVVLAAGAAVATWRARRDGCRLRVALEGLGAPVARATLEEVEAEAARLAPLRGCGEVVVEVAE
jgi:hypothetical protein